MTWRGSPPAGGDADPTGTGGALVAPAGRPSGGHAGGARPRIVGVDVARGLALVGMMAVHVFDTFDHDGRASLATVVAAGRSAATFALLAGVSLSWITGGPRTLRERNRIAVAGAVAARALCIGAIGLALGFVGDVAVILPYYAMFFLLAIPLLSLGPRVLAFAAAGIAVVVPVLMQATGSNPLGTRPGNPTFPLLVEHPARFLDKLLVTGTYPALVWMAYICAGLAIGQLDLASTRVAAWLFGAGLAVAVSAWLTSSVLLFPLGGLRHLRDAASAHADGPSATSVILWDPDRTSSSWWWLAVRAPHSSTPIDLLHTLGSATALLGAALLVTRAALIARLLFPVAAAGSMTLTLYSTHVLFLATGILSDQQAALYVVMVVVSLVFAAAWRRVTGRGPLEAAVTAAAGRAYRVISSRAISSARSPSAGRRGVRRPER
ncbi:DUF1624 domain-containing protein [Planosporangium thailandense]|uniref:DUF1624 domain-containing protein n=1 Tax=Planosporangium thailandense TaxID=765197 RepID=A0ABX0Y0X7_9ACTN|nr:heparan-alpha-glucosaminide N-acetyltransferase domain-containing protein [Planosporangium thailandense]NJC72001.1 DUF1624 domain-containing protein [Planosporangium thailandense]